MVKQFTISEGKIIPATGASGEILIYIDPDEQECRYLLDNLKIDDHTFHSALDPNELGRMEFEPDHVALIIKRPKRTAPRTISSSGSNRSVCSCSKTS